MSFADWVERDMSNPNDWRQTHQMQDIVAFDARSDDLDGLGSASWTMWT
jgi:hypothetical protein